ncbi:hypothetical protein BABINDRAFT_181684 [Babjeviella inositovora NRRL Y-12698]|uniref:Protein BFR2 n=1 Tax=Babjeviella inositovora NRRL Y-12698 TaxID=984486 RepID=A0A1E3QIL7_9ASCO|nr:uncharacterized protein BABINDRAFT_181684 [Babjeviella inositovora NRRL Y-12698]ODQ77448.1 hypothetical protein BABINDRAFT_181684 [Babjeviella inositovora NRRL Y-12698]
MAKSLAEQIAQLAQPDVTDFDIEDEGLKDVFANSDSEDDLQDDEEELMKRQHYVSVDKSVLRDHAPKLDTKYKGAVSSRKDLYSEQDQSGEESEIESEAESEAESEIEFEAESDSGVSLKTDSEYESDGKHNFNSDDEETAHKRSNLTKLMQQERKHIISRLSSTAKTDAVKGYSINKQRTLYDSIIDSRIKLQKAVQTANQLPLSAESFEGFAGKKSAKTLAKTEAKVYDLLDTILRLRKKLYKQDAIVADKDVAPLPKKRSYADYLASNATMDTQLATYRGAVLNKWSHKVQQSSGSTAINASKFKVVNQSLTIQVDNQLRDMEKLVKRTRLNRKNVTPLGYVAETGDTDAVDDGDAAGEDSNIIPSAHPAVAQIDTQHNNYIFDDEDFYRLLLNDLIANKLSSANPTSGNSQLITLTKSKVKKNVDTKASKGRKLRFHVQEAIQGFAAPVNGGKWKWNDWQIDEFFAGLLGQRVDMGEGDRRVEGGDESEEGLMNDDITIFG